MVRWIALAVLVVVVAAVVPLAVNSLPADVGGSVPGPPPQADDGPPPVVAIERDLTHDFGMMSAQDEGMTSWSVRNEGEGPLRMRFIEKPCTCTGVRLAEDGTPMEQGEEFNIPPGEAADVFLTWETRDKIGDYSTFARFATNDLEHNPTVTMTIKGIVSPAIVVNPASIEFPAAASDEEVSADTFLYSPSDPELAIVNEPTTSRPDRIVAEIRPLSEDEVEAIGVETMTAGYRVTVTLKPGLPLGKFGDTVVLKTNHPTRPEVEIPLSGLIVGPISAMPERVFMPGVPSTEGRSTYVTLNVRDQEQTAFDPRIPESLRDVLEVAIEPAEGGDAGASFHQYRMELRVPKGAKPGPYRGTVLLKTDHPKAEELKIPVDLLIRGG